MEKTHLKRLQGVGVAWISDGKNFNTQNFHSMCMGHQNHNLKRISTK
jgi:hypothetical protein